MVSQALDILVEALEDNADVTLDSTELTRTIIEYMKAQEKERYEQEQTRINNEWESVEKDRTGRFGLKSNGTNYLEQLSQLDSEWKANDALHENRIAAFRPEVHPSIRNLIELFLENRDNFYTEIERRKTYLESKSPL